MAEYPDEYSYTKEHEWISVEGDIATVGITDHAQAELGDIVYIELPAVGDQLEAGQPFGTIESVKAVSELYAPVSGEVLEVNEELVDRPELVNEECYGEGWIIVLRPDSPDELDQLLDAAGYGQHVQSREE